MRHILFASLILLMTPPAARAQGHVAGAFVINAQITPADAAGTEAPPPDGASMGVNVTAGAALGRRFGIDGELSVAGPVSSDVRHAHYLLGDFTDSSKERDIILSGLLRWHTQQAHCDVVGGVSVIWPRLEEHHLAVIRDAVPRTSERTEHPAWGPLIGLAGGLDFPLPVTSAFRILPTVRLHWIHRGEISAPQYVTHARPGPVVLRVGVGAEVTF
jgi:hypothetical protein